MQNLIKYQLPNVDPDHVLLQEDSSDKTDRRVRVMQEHNVLLLIGDNLRDFDEVFKDRSRNYGKEVVKSYVNEMLPKYIILPNPMYGHWESTTYDFDYRLPRDQQLQRKRDALTGPD